MQYIVRRIVVGFGDLAPEHRCAVEWVEDALRRESHAAEPTCVFEERYTENKEQQREKRPKGQAAEGKEKTAERAEGKENGCGQWSAGADTGIGTVEGCGVDVDLAA